MNKGSSQLKKCQLTGTSVAGFYPPTRVTENAKKIQNMWQKEFPQIPKLRKGEKFP